jgi:hypothetical protein
MYSGVEHIAKGEHMENLTGNKYGYWTVIRFHHVTPTYQYYWECKCICGVQKSVLASSLKSGCRKSCGCKKKELQSESLSTHGMSNTPTYTSWEHLIARCKNPNSDYFKNYGGRGIDVCDRWLVFENFLRDMGIRPEGTSIDRIDVNGNYTKDNCRWATPFTQGNNTTRNIYHEYEGVTLTLSEWSRIMGIAIPTIRNRIMRRNETFAQVADYFIKNGRWDGRTVT